ncbi:MAG: alpha/beta hydrolase [Lewinellaceae bacterium]|nr:alpha/beta hydrolase [Lewinella sp.]MCB9282003.1 alpha/beta hydrolase [Lewinellaceae bacterium]
MKKISFAVAVLLLTFSCRNTDTAAEEKKVDSPLHYDLTGTGDVTLVFIHGWCINGSYWDNQVAAFKDRYQVLTLDLAGHGQSKMPKPEYTIEEHGRDVADLITQLGLKKIILIGHSMSGDVALHVYNILRNRVMGFIGIDNLQQLGVIPTDEENEQYAAFFLAMRKDFANLVTEFAKANLFSETTSDSIKARVIRDFVSADVDFAVSTIVSLQFEGENERTLAPKLMVPMYLILSDNGRDPLYEEASLKQYCGAGYKVWTIKGTGHYPMIEDVPEFNRVLAEVLDTIRNNFSGQ